MVHLISDRAFAIRRTADRESDSDVTVMKGLAQSALDDVDGARKLAEVFALSIATGVNSSQFFYAPSIRIKKKYPFMGKEPQMEFKSCCEVKESSKYKTCSDYAFYSADESWKPKVIMQLEATFRNCTLMKAIVAADPSRDVSDVAVSV